MQFTTDQILEQGIAAHEAGNLHDAEQLYRSILQTQPKHPEANHNLGVLLISTNDLKAALPLFKTALEANSKNEQFWLSYLDALIKDRQVDIALKTLEQARKQGVDTGSLNYLERQLSSQTNNPSTIKANPPEELLHSLLWHYQNGQLSAAERLSLEIIQNFPKQKLAWQVLGAVLGATGRKLEALDASRTVVALSPQDAEAHSNLGVSLQALGRSDEAEASYNHAIALKPDYADAHFNLGIMLKELSRLDEAEASYARAIFLEPDYADAHYNLGIMLQEQGRLEEAKTSYEQAIASKLDYGDAHNNLGSTLKELGRLDEAEASYKQAIALKPDSAEVHNNLGITLKELGRLEGALASYRQAVDLKPDLSEAHHNLCELLEKMNRSDELLSVIRSEPTKNLEKQDDFLYYEALIEFRKENYETAVELVEKINMNELTQERLPAAMKLQGDLYHYKKDYSAAFESYKSQNNLVKDSLEYKKQDSENFFTQLKKTVFQIQQSQKDSSYKPVIKPRGIQPTFLIGFPRSGTTLLDTILRSHSNIDVLEELPMMAKMNASLGGITTVRQIEAMDANAAEIASGYYFEELQKHAEIGKKQTLVDKLPLNILQLPLINHVFPNTKYIIALRHPLDCVLSCWMQNFKLNAPMANMVDLERIVDFYDVAMSILKLSEERYLLEAHRIRYEDLVVNFEESVSNLLRFLGLEWEEELRSYQKTALARGRILTPSSSQVIKPLYQTAVYRWTHYEEYLEQYKKRLAPWIQEYGYST